jgi:hypothetical protein
MITIEQHKLTRRQVELLIHALESTEFADVQDEQAVGDMLEALDNKIFGGEQKILIQYVTGIESLPE